MVIFKIRLIMVLYGVYVNRMYFFFLILVLVLGEFSVFYKIVKMILIMLSKIIDVNCLFVFVLIFFSYFVMEVIWKVCSSFMVLINKMEILSDDVI